MMKMNREESSKIFLHSFCGSSLKMFEMEIQMKQTLLKFEILKIRLKIRRSVHLLNLRFIPVFTKESK